MLFDQQTLRAFSLRFPTLDLAIVTEAAEWVAKLDARESINNPSAMLESILQQRANALHVQQAGERTPRQKPPQGLQPMSDADWQASDEARQRCMAELRARFHCEPSDLRAAEGES